MRVFLRGVRGSTPAPGSEFARFGGHTSCVALAHDGGEVVLVLDAGTGIRRVSHLLHGHAYQGTILLSHLHWDHTQGLPFFAAGDRPDARVHLVLPDNGGDPVEVLGRAMGPPHFPSDPGNSTASGRSPAGARAASRSRASRCTPSTSPTRAGARLGSGSPTGDRRWPTSPTTARSRWGRAPTGSAPYHDAVMALAEGAGLLVHDAQHAAEELPARAHYGHCAAENAMGLGEAAGAGAVMLFHHDPGRVDDDVDDLAARFQDAALPVLAAAEGLVLDPTSSLPT